MHFAGTSPAVGNPPPAKSRAPEPSSNTSSALTIEPLAVIPLPNAAQLDPFHLAMRFAAAPPALVKDPPAYNAGPVPSSSAASTRTSADAGATPLPTGAQLAPSHLARLLAATPPALVKFPPAYSAGPVPSSYTASAWTNVEPPVIPLPSDDQLEPFHLAMRFAGS